MVLHAIWLGRSRALQGCRSAPVCCEKLASRRERDGFIADGSAGDEVERALGLARQAVAPVPAERGRFCRFSRPGCRMGWSCPTAKAFRCSARFSLTASRWRSRSPAPSARVRKALATPGFRERTLLPDLPP